mgnify:CR=1 FL=1
MSPPCISDVKSAITRRSLSPRRRGRRRYGRPSRTPSSLRAHIVIAFGISLDLLEGLPGGIGQDLVEGRTGLANLARSDLDLGLLAGSTAARLVNHHHGIGQAETLALGPAAQEHGGHGGGHAHADGRGWPGRNRPRRPGN